MSLPIIIIIIIIIIKLTEKCIQSELKFCEDSRF